MREKEREWVPAVGSRSSSSSSNFSPQRLATYCAPRLSRRDRNHRHGFAGIVLKMANIARVLLIVIFAFAFPSEIEM